MPTHMAQLYLDPRLLAATIARFTADGLAAGDAVVLLLTAEHWEAARARLVAGNHDVEASIAEGRLQVVDATRALADLTRDGGVQPEAFERVVHALIELAGRHGPRTRVFGELVNLLAASGRYTEAARLEELWNTLARRRTFSLLCAYHLTPFDPAASDLLQEVCRSHQHVDIGVEEQRFVSALEEAIVAELGESGALALRTAAATRRGPQWEQLLNELHASFPLVAGQVLRRADALFEQSAPRQT